MTQPDPNTQSGAGGAQSGTDPGTPPPTDSGTQSGDTGTPTGGQPPAKTLAEVQAELDATIRRMQAADRNNSAAQVELKKFQDAQLTEQDRAKRDLAEAQAEREKLAAEKEALEIKVAFLADTTYKWKNPDHALRLIDLSDVKMDKGKLTGLKEAMKGLADEAKYLLADTSAGDGNTGGTPPPPAGSTVPMTGGQGGNGSPNAASLAKDFPALRTRGLGA